MADESNRGPWTPEEVRREEHAERVRVRRDAARGVTQNLRDAVAHTGVRETVLGGLQPCPEGMTDALNPEPLLRALHQARVQHIIIGADLIAMKRAAGRPRPGRPEASRRRVWEIVTLLGTFDLEEPPGQRPAGNTFNVRPFTPTNALSTLLTVESLVFSVLNVALALTAATSLPRRARTEARLLALASATAVTILGFGAAVAWWRLFAGDWPSRLDEQLPVLCLAAGIVVQPVIPWS